MPAPSASRPRLKLDRPPLPARNAPLRKRGDAGGGMGFNFGFGGGISPDGYSGASFGPHQGWVYFPQLDTRFEISPYTRTELLRRSRALYANLGLARRIIRGIANMVVGAQGLQVLPRTDDAEWNKLAKARFDTRAASREIWDVGGRFNFVGDQRLTVRRMLLDGDFAKIPVLSAAGGMRFRFFEAHQIGNGTLDDAGWFDGVLVNGANRPLRYNILGDNPEDARALPASQVIFCCDYERGGAVRGKTILAHAIRKMISKAEIENFIQKGLRVSNDQGVYIKTAPERTDAPSADDTFADETDNPKVRIDTPRGPVDLAQMAGGGAIPELPPGKSYEILQDTRPHPNGISFLDYMVRDICWGTDYSPEILWNIAALGGANTRYVLNQAQASTEELQQLLVDCSLARQYAQVIGADLATGALRPCQDPQWWKHIWIRPARQTVDFTRDGKLLIEQANHGYISPQRIYGMRGEQAFVELDAIIEYWGYAKKKAAAEGLTLYEAFPGRYTPPPQNQPTDAGAVEDAPKPAPAKEADGDAAPEEDDDGLEETMTGWKLPPPPDHFHHELPAHF